MELRVTSRLLAPCFNNMSKAPEITRTRLYLETMSEILPQMGQKIIVDVVLAATASDPAALY